MGTAALATLASVKAEARRLARAGDALGALRTYDALLASVPLDHEVRFKIADMLTGVGLIEEAAEVYRTVAVHDIRSGHPLPGIIAAHALVELGQPVDEILGLLAATYASGSPQLARFAVRPAPVDPATAVKVPDLSRPEPSDATADRARVRALDLSVFKQYQEQYHPLPFFSELGPDSFLAVLRQLRVRRLADGEMVMRQGDPGTALYLVAAGELRVFVTAPDGAHKEVARLHENTLFGEMALITDQPRSASVEVVGEADVLEVSRDALAEVTARIPAIGDVLDRFARERLIKNVLSHSPLFTPFTKAQQRELLQRFEGVDVDPGTDIIQEGAPGSGLYVVLSGELEVIANRDGVPVVLALLGAGDICGEMSLVMEQPASATVRARQRSTLLFLARGYVERLTSAIPEVREYFEALALQRARDNTLTLTRVGVREEVIEVDVDDMIPV